LCFPSPGPFRGCPPHYAFYTRRRSKITRFCFLSALASFTFFSTADTRILFSPSSFANGISRAPLLPTIDRLLSYRSSCFEFSIRFVHFFELLPHSYLNRRNRSFLPSGSPMKDGSPPPLSYFLLSDRLNLSLHVLDVSPLILQKSLFYTWRSPPPSPVRFLLCTEV